MYVQYLLKAFTLVWGLIWEIPVPRFELAEKKLQPALLARWVMALFPLMGCLIGVALSLLGAFSDLLYGRMASALLFAIMSLFFLEVLYAGKGLCFWSSVTEKIFRGNDLPRSMLTAETDINVARLPVGMIAMFSLLLLRGCCLAILYAAGYGNWMALTFVVGYTLQGRLATVPLVSGGYIVKTDSGGEFILATVAVITTLVIGRGFMVQTLAGLLLSGLAVWGITVFCRRKTGGVTGAMIGGAGYIWETLLLLLGAGWLVG